MRTPQQIQRQYRRSRPYLQRPPEGHPGVPATVLIPAASAPDPPAPSPSAPFVSSVASGLETYSIPRLTFHTTQATPQNDLRQELTSPTHG